MASPKSIHVCSQCGQTTPRWVGQCPGCEEWNTMVEEISGTTARNNGRRSLSNVTVPEIVALRDVEVQRIQRLRTGIGELDRVLGGGIVPGSLVLLGGSPGIGKSTLTGMVLGNLAGSGTSVLYVSGEESAAQVRMRHERVETATCRALDVPAMAETDLDTVLAAIAQLRPEVCVIDSVQTLSDGALAGAPGSVGQVREVASRLMRAAKDSGTAVILVGHVTKEGSIAGPRVLEHLVDCVLQFEGEQERTYRTLRAAKNRFGSASETGVFEMRESGLVEVLDPSALFVGEATGKPGSVILASMEGTRPLLVEVQALVSESELVPPRRVCNGIDRNRLALVLAVLGRHAGISTGSSDVFVNVVGGVRVEEPGADLAVALAIASAAKGVSIGDQGKPLCAFGEVGLTGELRAVGHSERRLGEASKFGLDSVIGPQGTLKDAVRRALHGTVKVSAVPLTADAA